MKRRWLLLLTLLWSTVPVQGRSSESSFDPAREDAYLAPSLETGNFSGSILIARTFERDASGRVTGLRYDENVGQRSGSR